MEVSHVAFSQQHLEDNLKPLSDLDRYTIEKGDPDPRGSAVVTSDGRRIGEVVDLIVDTSAMKVRYLVVDPIEDSTVPAAGERSFLLNIDDVQVREDSREVVAHSYSGEEAAYTRPAPSERFDREGKTLTRTEEELYVGKREVSRGEARIGKHVETEHVSQPVTRRREEVVVERRPVEAGVRGDASIGDDEIRIPLTEEELVVEKRPVVKEELVVGKRTVEERDTVETDVRREEFDIDTNTSASTRDRGSRRGDR
jgi:uncharacterized protein (TIGR02271 family)